MYYFCSVVGPPSRCECVSLVYLKQSTAENSTNTSFVLEFQFMKKYNSTSKTHRQSLYKEELGGHWEFTLTLQFISHQPSAGWFSVTF